MNHAAVIALAATLGGLAGAPAQAQSFSGPSIGLQAAYEDYDGAEGRTLALAGGWDFAVSPKWIIGAGAHVTVDGLEDGQVQRLGANISRSRIAIEDQRGLSARAGRVIGSRTLVYAEVGHEWFHVNAVRELRAQVCAPPSGCLISRLNGSFDETMVTIGAGAEWAVTDQWRLRGAYSHGDSDAFERNRFSVSAAYQF